MDPTAKYNLKQIDDLLAASNQSWLFGAGISLNSGIPLMRPLTDQVFKRVAAEGEKNDKKVLEFIKGQLSEDSHIEHVLSQIGDHRAIAERLKDQKVEFDGFSLDLDALDELYQRIITCVADTIRWGYKAKYKDDAADEVGTRDAPIVNVVDHSAFVSALFNRSQAGIEERRRAVRLFTTNYDTLLEDALALGGISYWDGFDGGAVAYRSHRYGEDVPNHGHRAHIIKLHGSIDWHLGQDSRVIRVRDSDLYPETISRVLIYPQSTKYLATQRDPFAAQFDLLRRALGSHEENVLATCGYSFGDEHINQEIEFALQRPENKTVILAFSQKINSILEKWRTEPWGKRLYIIAEDGLYIGGDGPCVPPPNSEPHDWWKFGGVTKILDNGAEACVS